MFWHPCLYNNVFSCLLHWIIQRLYYLLESHDFYGKSYGNYDNILYTRKVLVKNVSLLRSHKISVRYKERITRYVRNVSMCTLQATIEHAMLQFYLVADKSEYNIEHVFSSLNE